MENIYYSRRIKGVSIPGIIYNCKRYCYTDLSVYEDGVVNCWHAVSLQGFRKEIAKGWVVPQVPCKGEFSVHGIGSFEIQEASWIYDKDSFFEHVVDIVKQMNPDLKNLHEIQDKEIIDKRYAFPAAPGTPYREEGNYVRSIINGSQNMTVYRKDGRLCMTELSVYKDRHFRIGMEEDRLFSLEEITDMIQADILYSYLVEGEWLYLPDLGNIKVCLLAYTKPIAKEERIKEIESWCVRTAGEDDAIDRCVMAYHEYLEWPTEEKRERLKQLYLAVPKHERGYLSDAKDFDYIRIIYHPERKREV